MASATESADTSAPASTSAHTVPPSTQQAPSSSADSSLSVAPQIISSFTLPVEDQADEDEEEVTTAEFSVDLTDGQTWAINFYECAAEGDLECLEEILDSGRVGVNDVDVDGFTALMVAAAEGHRNIVQALIKRGADVCVRTHELRSTALHFAAKNGDAEVVAALCECDAAVVDCWNVNADTPLIWACIEGRAEAVKVLLKHGADVNMLNQYGATTLLCAVMIGEDPEQDAESDKKRAEIVTMLLEKNSKLVNFQDREGSTAMHLAASCGYLECVKTLLEFGADITLRNAIGQTPLEEAQGSELRESGPCVEFLQGMWKKLEEEAAARMMAMLEMEEEAGKSNGANSSSGKKSKKKNKKAKRKAAKQQQQRGQDRVPEQEQEQKEQLIDDEEKAVDLESAAGKTQTEPIYTEAAVNDDFAESKEDVSSASDVEDVTARESFVSTGHEHTDDEDDGDAETNHTATIEDEHGVQIVTTTPSPGAWTTVGKKHRATPSGDPVKPSSSPTDQVQPSACARQKPTVSPPKCASQPPRRANVHPANRQAKGSAGVRVKTPVPSLSFRKGATRASVRPREERWEESKGLLATSRTSRSVASASFLNPNALAFRSVAPASGPSTFSSTSGLYSDESPFSAALSWRPSFGSSATTSSYTTPSLSSASLHYTAVGRLAWKQHQRLNGGQQLAREARERWVRKLELSNENVAETLGYLACGLCGELVNDNLQCSGRSSSNGSDQKSVVCTQLYCASCLESPAFQTAESTAFKCVRCRQVIPKDSLTRNSFAQAQAAALGLSLSSSVVGTQNDSTRYSLEEMQHVLEVSEPRVAAVDLAAFHLVPGTDLSALSNGQLEVLMAAHQRALDQIVEQRLTNARMLERLQMEEWMKMQRDVLQYNPR